ncbi:MAG: hemolysin family protein [Alphaproteobacteria bacterium]|nr:hemolysin family protein [Alphaproteobacteria bacterium]
MTQQAAMTERATPETPPAPTQDEPEPRLGSVSAPAPKNEKSLITHTIAWIKGLPLWRNGSNRADEFREAIEELIEDKSDAPRTAIAAHERTLIANVLELRDLPVLDVMVPRADIVSVDINITRESLYQVIAERPHSRMPVYKDDLDNIVGVLHMKDVVANITAQNNFEIKDILRDSLVVSPAMRVLDLLLQMRQSKVHIAFVVDEFGGIDGLITINDLIEAIVGEIDDEFDFEITPQLIERPDGSAVADARYAVEDFEKTYGPVFAEDEENEEADTLGGLVCYIAGHVPARGEVIKHKSGIEFEVIDADPRRVMRMRIRNLPQKPYPE